MSVVACVWLVWTLCRAEIARDRRRVCYRQPTFQVSIAQSVVISRDLVLTTRSLGSTWRPWRFENSASSAAEAAVPRGVGAMASSDEPIATRERKRHKTRNGEKRVSLSFAPRMFAKHRSPRDPMVQYWVEPSSPMLSLSGAGGPHPLILASMRCRLRWNVAHAGVRGLGVSALACPP